LESIKELSSYDLEDLRSTVNLLGEQVTLTPEISIVQNYGNALRQLKRLNPDYAGHAKQDLLFLARLVLNDKEEVVKSLSATYRDIYRAEILTTVISQVDYLSFLQSNTQSSVWRIHFLVWRYILSYVRVDASTKPYLTALLKNSLSAIGGMFSQSDPDLPSPQAETVLEAIINATNSNKIFIFEVGQNHQDDKIFQPFAWLYYKLAGNLSLADRRPYRNLASSLIPKLLAYEIRRDIRGCGINRIAQTYPGTENKNRRIASW
jgi:hypothetical protein